MSEEQKPLQKVSEVELQGKKYDLARNGQFYLAVEGRDCYGRPSTDVVDLANWLHAGRGLPAGCVEKIQALLDALGAAHVSLQGQRDLRRGDAPGVLE